jgi:hypothetical protein
MSARAVAIGFVGSMLLLASARYGAASETNTHFALQPRTAYVDPERTNSVTLGTLSVRQNPLDRPWNPRICIGCDRNNGPLPDQSRTGRYR